MGWSSPQPASSALLTALNVGDSGFLVVRGGSVVYRCPTVSHAFNCPKQLGCESHYPETDGVADGVAAEVREEERCSMAREEPMTMV